MISASEFGEMREFSATVETRVASLPDKPERAASSPSRKIFRRPLLERPLPNASRSWPGASGSALLRAYPVPMAPATAPDAARGAVFTPRIARPAMVRPATAKARQPPAQPAADCFQGRGPRGASGASLRWIRLLPRASTGRRWRASRICRPMTDGRSHFTWAASSFSRADVQEGERSGRANQSCTAAFQIWRRWCR